MARPMSCNTNNYVFFEGTKYFNEKAFATYLGLVYKVKKNKAIKLFNEAILLDELSQEFFIRKKIGVVSVDEDDLSDEPIFFVVYKGNIVNSKELFLALSKNDSIVYLDFYKYLKKEYSILGAGDAFDKFALSLVDRLTKDLIIVINGEKFYSIEELRVFLNKEFGFSLSAEAFTKWYQEISSLSNEEKVARLVENMNIWSTQTPNSFKENKSSDLIVDGKVFENYTDLAFYLAGIYFKGKEMKDIKYLAQRIGSKFRKGVWIKGDVTKEVHKYMKERFGGE